MGVARKLQSAQTRILIVTIVTYVILTVFYAYYPLAESFVFTYFSTPGLYGVLVSERFQSVYWWITSLWSLSWFAVFWSMWMLIFWKSKPYKIAFLIYLGISMVWWFSIFIVQFIWLLNKNDPSFPDNPASSYRACCTPEFYNTVPTCPNFGSAAPECNPPINLSELGVNGDFVFAFAFNIVLFALWGVYIALTVNFMRLVDEFALKGDANYVPVKLDNIENGAETIVPKQGLATQLPLASSINPSKRPNHPTLVMTDAERKRLIETMIK